MNTSCDTCGDELVRPVSPDGIMYALTCDTCSPRPYLCHGCGFDLGDWEGEGPPTCYDCDDSDSLALGNYFMKHGQYCDGTKRILALPGNHPDANPSSQREAERTMAKHGICRDTGFWKDETKKEAAMLEAKRRPPAEAKKGRKRSH